jgi:putative glutamine amidotransferase
MKKPVIGITLSTNAKSTRYYIPTEYIPPLAGTAAIPILLPPMKEPEDIIRFADMIDGLLLPGGVDIDPVHYGEEPTKTRRIDSEKDSLELALLGIVDSRDLPILGICRGAQVLNVFRGGSLNQDFRDGLKHWQQAPENYPTHALDIVEGSLLHRIVGRTELRVNTYHHQTIRDLGKGLVASARSKDDVIEAVEDPDKTFVLAVQFHAEDMWEQEGFKGIFEAFVRACASI